MDFLGQLKESVLIVRLQKLDNTARALQQQQRQGKLGPRVVRARARIIRRQQRELAALARDCGYPIED